MTSGVRTHPDTEAYRVYERLRRDIRSGQIAPGTPLRTEWLKTTYRASTSPLREALARLHAEYYVSAQGKRGFRAAELRRDDYENLIELRNDLECRALRKSLANRSEKWEVRVVVAHHALSKTTIRAVDDLEQVENREARHRQFHLALLSECGSAWLLRAYDQMASHAERYARIIRRGEVEQAGYLERVDNEHRKLMDLAFAGATEAAIELMMAHRARTYGSVLAAMGPTGIMTGEATGFDPGLDYASNAL